MVMLFGKQISVSTTTSHQIQHQEAESDDNPPLMGSLGGDSKTRVFVPDHHQENPADPSSDSDVNLAKFRGEVDPSSFLGLRAQDPSNHILHSGNSKTRVYSDVNLGKSSILGLRAQESEEPTVVLNPEPLRWFHPSNRILHSGSCDGASSSSSSSNFVSHGQNKNLRGKRKKIKNNYPQVPTVNLSHEFRRGIIGQTIHGPVFLYRKKLEGSDVKKQLNRLLITEEEKPMDGFLTGNETEMFHGQGVNIDVVGVDGRGREYELRLSKWKTMIVINKEWYKMVVANGAVAGHWVDLWGFRRHDAKIRFAVNFISSH